MLNLDPGLLTLVYSKECKMQRRWIVVVVCLLAMVGSAGAQSAPQEPRYFAIKGARIVPVAGPVIEEGTVVVANGLITAVGKDAPIPPEAWVIDGKGLTVYPGLIDALTDLGLQAPPARGGPPGQAQAPAPQPAQPAPQQRPRSEGPEDRPGTTPWRAAADELRTDDRRIEQWRNAGFTTALSSPRAGIFSGQGAVINLAGERPGEMVVKTPATLLIQLQPTGSLFTGFPGSLMGVMAYVKQVYADTAQYAAAEPVLAQARGIERLPYDRTVRVIHRSQREQWPVLIPGNRTGEIVRGLELAQQLGVRGVLYGAQQGYDATGEIAARKTPVLVNLKWPEKERDADPEAEEPLETLRFRDRAPSTPAALEKAGVTFAFYSGGITSPADIRRNAKKAVDAGLSAERALRAFTLDAAGILGVGDRLGSIEPGKIANLVVTDGDLWDEKTKVKMVFVDGRRFEVREAPQPEREREEGERTPPGVER
jgi:imidazolonepropionase-like amidohydrolase